MADPDPLLAFRPRFPILDRTTYLVSHSLGAMPAAVREHLSAYADAWAGEGVLAWERWLPMVTEVGDLVGRIIGAPPGSVVLHQNVSVLQAIIASCFDFAPPRTKVVYEDQNFPTVHYVWKAHERRGARVVVVPSEPDGTVPTERMVEAIDEETLVVPMSLVCFRTSYLQDARAIVRRAHDVGALVLIDAYQATGTVPFDVRDLDVDILVGGSVKWLCGGPGAAYLYVRPDLVERLRPAACGWFSHPDPFAFEMGDEVRYAASAWRFVGGSPSVPALYAARAGYEIILEAGVHRIREKSTRLTGRLIEAARSRGLAVRTPSDPARRGGTASIDFEGSADVAKELVARRFLVDHRPGGGIRISPHFYTREDEIDAVMAEIDAIRRGGPETWLHLRRPAGGRF